MQMSASVSGLARRREALQFHPRILAFQKRTRVAARKAFREQLRFRLQPDGGASIQDGLPQLRGEERSAAGRDDARRRRDQPPHLLSLPPPERGLALPVKDFRQAEARLSLDLFVRIGEGEAEPLRERPADARLSGAHHPHEHDRASEKLRRAGHPAGAIQGAVTWGKRRAMRRTYLTPQRRRRSPGKYILILLLLLLVGGIIYASTVNTEVPTSRIEQDVTNAALAS